MLQLQLLSDVLFAHFGIGTEAYLKRFVDDVCIAWENAFPINRLFCIRNLWHLWNKLFLHHGNRPFFICDLWQP